jgi:hypothetical protein
MHIHICTRLYVIVARVVLCLCVVVYLDGSPAHAVNGLPEGPSRVLLDAHRLPVPVHQRRENLLGGHDTPQRQLTQDEDKHMGYLLVYQHALVHYSARSRPVLVYICDHRICAQSARAEAVRGAGNSPCRVQQLLVI